MMTKLLLGLISFLMLTTAAAEIRIEDRFTHARHRMLEVALAQSESMSSKWDPGQRDCAGFVRFVMRESTTGRAEMWRNRQGESKAFVTADELIAFNFHKVADRFDAERAQTGDLLVYHRPDRKPEDAWHLMMLLEPPPHIPRSWLVIYHNGAQGSKGQVRLVALTDLESTVHGEWRPQAGNSGFLGVYRWNGFKLKSTAAR